jgi:hypothetical protein
MAYVDGTIIVSGDYNGDLDKIVAALNLLDFGNNAEFVSQDGGIRLYKSSVECPTAFPHRTFLKFKDGGRIPEDEADNEQKIAWFRENRIYDFDECEPEWFSKKVSPLLTSGTLEIVAIGHEEPNERSDHTRYAYLERLLIHSNGTIGKHRNFFETSFPKGESFKNSKRHQKAREQSIFDRHYRPQACEACGY